MLAGLVGHILPMIVVRVSPFTTLPQGLQAGVGRVVMPVDVHWNTTQSVGIVSSQLTQGIVAVVVNGVTSVVQIPLGKLGVGPVNV